MRENPIGNALAFLIATDKLWFTVIFWLLLLGSAAIAASAWRADPDQRSLHHIGYGLMRVIIGIMWWQQSLWKIPPHWDWGLIHWMEVMVEHASTQLQSTLVRDLVLPNIAVFGPLVYAIEVYHSGIADPRRPDPSRRGTWRTDGDQSVARTLQRAQRMALDLYVPGGAAANLSDQPARTQPRHRRLLWRPEGSARKEAPFLSFVA